MNLGTTDPWDMRKKLKEHYTALAKRDEEVWSGNLYPTAMVDGPGAQCNLFLAYIDLGMEKRIFPDPGMKKAGETGQDRHKRMEENLVKIYGRDRIRIEIPYVDAELHMRGKADADLDRVHGWDLKGVSKREFPDIVMNHRPRRKDYDQMQLYIHHFGWEDCTLLYECKDGLHEEEYIVVLPDEDRYQYFRNRILNEVLLPLNRGERPLRSRGGHCGDCPYQIPCKENRL
jgi:hypothetical protein